MHLWIWMKCCVSTDVGTWTNWLTFEPDLDYSPDARTGLLSPISYKCCNAEFYYIGKGYPLGYWPLIAAARRGFKMVLLTASRRNTFVGGTCALPSAILVNSVIMSVSRMTRERINRCQPNMVVLNLRLTLTATNFWCWFGLGCGSRISSLTLGDGHFVWHCSSLSRWGFLHNICSLTAG